MEAGKISNLITDMTLNGATKEELERAINHSVIVLDSSKKYEDIKKSRIDNGIAQLEKKYQIRKIYKPYNGNTH